MGMGRYRYGRYHPEGEELEPEKVCRTCGLPLPLSAYYRKAGGAQGRRSQCKACRAAADHAYHQVHPVKPGRHKRKSEREQRGER